MAPRLILLCPLGPKRRSPDTRLKEAKAVHSHRMWDEFSSSVPYLLHNGMSESPMRWRFLLKVLCPCIPLNFFLTKTSVGLTFNILLFYIHGSVHRESNLITVQQDATAFSLLYFCRQLYMFRVLTPINRSSYNCNYSFWNWLTGSTTIRSRCWVGTDSCTELPTEI